MPRISFILPLLIATALPAAAQDGLAARNEAFLQAAQDANRDSIAAFFPRRGDWTWVQKQVGAPPGRDVSIWRFAATETMRAIGRDGPACWSFEQMHGEVGPVETMLSMVARMSRGPWRRVGATRFVPRGKSDAFVEWRREDGRWVVSAFGDAASYRGPRLPGRERRGGGQRDTVLRLPPTPVYAADASWFVNNEPFYFDGRRYVKYGLPRPIDPALLTRVGRFGMMGVYVQKNRPLDSEVEVLYVPVRPGEYQPYEGLPVIRHCG